MSADARRARLAFRRLASVGVVSCALAAAPAHAQEFVRVSAAADGTPATLESTAGAISSDGVWAAFASRAPNLVANDTNSEWDVFLKNLQTNAVTRVSVATDGTERAANSGQDGLDLSANGQVIVFASQSAFAADDTNTCLLSDNHTTGPCPDIYVRDVVANTTTRISLGSGNVQANGRSFRPRISDDGRYVVFSSLATNLVPQDTNGVEDVFLYDRTLGSITRVSVASDTSQADGPSTNGEISGDGSTIAFLSAATNLTSVPDPLLCHASTSPGTNCFRTFVHTRTTGATTPVRVTVPVALNPFPPNEPLGSHLYDVSLDATGRFVGVGVARLSDACCGNVHDTFVVLYDRGQQQTVRTLGPITVRGGPPLGGPAISGNGHVVLHGGGYFQVQLSTTVNTYELFDRHTGLFEPTQHILTADFTRLLFNPTLSSDGRVVVFQRNNEIWRLNRDVDADGLADTWETRFGLNPASNADGILDPDNDGRTNLHEYQAGSHPTAVMARYFAEGGSNAFFRTRIALMNTSSSESTVMLRYLGSGGGNTASTLTTVPALTRVTFDLGPGSNVPANDFSTVIEANQNFAADRTMTWDATGFGAHAETAITAPALNWFLAEGATHGAFDLFYLIQNANDVDATVTVNYLRPAPLPPIVRVYSVPANSRQTIWVDNEHADLAATDVSAQFVSSLPIIVERAMYLSPAGQPAFVAGHDGAGVTAPSATWFLAEGATGGFFDEYVLIANPGTTDAVATVTYLLPDAPSFTKQYTVARQSRLTIGVDGEDPRLAGTSVGISVDSTQPVIVERAMWWPSPNWYEGHLAVGATTTGTRWALAEGQAGVTPGTVGDTETFILIANTGATAGTAAVTLYHDASPAIPTSQITVDLPANSRVTVPVSGSFPVNSFATSRRFGAVIESSGVPIVVERAIYTTVNGVFWSAGTSSLGTKLQ